MREELMNNKCVKCGRELPDGASFCPYCTAVQTEKQNIHMPRRWKKKALILLAVLIIAGAVGAAFAWYHRPQIYEGGAQITYTDKDGSYKVLLNFDAAEGVTGHALGERSVTCGEGLDGWLPCQLYVLNQDTGELAGTAFSEKVASCRVDTNASEESQKLEYVEPVYNEDFPGAAYVSDVHYTAYSGTNDILWTLQMKNGDTITLTTRLTVEKLAAVSYDAEDTPMETAEELNALLATIEEEVPSDTPVHLSLPAVTYDEKIDFDDRTWIISGSEEGRTVFADTVSIQGLDGNYAELSGISFEGNGGTGLDAFCLVLLTGCSFDGWETAAYSEDGSWVNVNECTFTNNQTALKFDTTFAYGTEPDYLDNVFKDNDTAVRIDSLPGSEVLNFAGSTFSGNKVDIENEAEHPVETVNAAFE